MSAGEFDHYYWTNKARSEMGALITQMGLQSCPVCERESLYVLPWPGMMSIGGSPEKAVGESHRGNRLFIALVRCESCGYVMMFDSEKLNPSDERTLWAGPGPPTDAP